MRMAYFDRVCARAKRVILVWIFVFVIAYGWEEDKISRIHSTPFMEMFVRTLVCSRSLGS